MHHTITEEQVREALENFGSVRFLDSDRNTAIIAAFRDPDKVVSANDVNEFLRTHSGQQVYLENDGVSVDMALPLSNHFGALRSNSEAVREFTGIYLADLQVLKEYLMDLNGIAGAGHGQVH